jgi:hypothetical protein
MRKRAAFISVLLLQFASAIAFVPFMSHLVQIWNNHGGGWWESFRAEYAQGRFIMLVEFVVVGIAVIATVAFEVWLLISGDKDTKKIVSSIDKLADEIRLERENRNGESKSSKPNESDYGNL